MTDESNNKTPLPPPFFGKPKSFDLQGLIDPTTTNPVPGFAPPKQPQTTQSQPTAPTQPVPTAQPTSPYAPPPGMVRTPKPQPAPQQPEIQEHQPVGPTYGGGGFSADASLASLIEQSHEQHEIEQAAQPEKKSKATSSDFDLNMKEVRRYFHLAQQQVLIFKEKYQKPLLILNLIWACFITSIYVFGITFFALFFNFYFKFTPIMEEYLKSHNLSDVSFNVTGHNLSEITLSDIRHSKGLFKIKNIKLQYTFMNLLKRKISIADIDGLTIQLTDKGFDGFNFSDFASFFEKIGIFKDGQDRVKIQSIQIRNAKLLIGNDTYQVPIEFTGNGDMDMKNQLVIPFIYSGEFLKIQSKLTLNFSNIGTSWKFAIENGKITLPEMAPEDLSGTISLKTTGKNLSALNTSLIMKKDAREKILNVDITPAKDDRINIKTALNITEGSQDKPFTAEFELYNVVWGKDLRSIKTDDAFNVMLKNIQTPFINLESVQVNLIGTLDCRDTACQYTITKPSTLILFGPSKQFYDTTVSASTLRVVLSPQKPFLFTLKDNLLNINALIAEGSYDLQKKSEETTDENTGKKPLVIAFRDGQILAGYHLLERNGAIKISGKNGTYTDDLVSIKEASFQTETNADGTQIALVSPEVSLASDAFKLPFSLDIQVDAKNYFNALLKTKNNMIDVKGGGYFNPYTGDFMTSIETVAPIVFESQGIQLPQISSLFDKNIRNLEGNIQMKGYVHLINAMNVSGPLHLLLNDVSFDYENVNVNQLSTLLTISSLVPFGTSQAQTAFIQSMTTLLPFKGIDSTFYFDSSKKQMNISKMTLNVAGGKFRIDPVWIPYHTNMSFIFKDKAFSLSSLAKQMNIQGLQMSGLGQAEITVLMENGRMQLKNMEIDIGGEGYIRYIGEASKDGFEKSFKNLEFKNAKILMSELSDGSTDFSIMAEPRNTVEKRRITHRFNIAQPLRDFLKEDTTQYEKPADLFGQ
ncbi:MAG: YdbH domain-containing protein [Alphaproteobacteria bacterium]|nr:YdbH domain-containing protein [Alphaproteobacteria bacterium]